MSITFPLVTKNARVQAIVDSVNTGTLNASGQIWLKDSGSNTLAKLAMSNPAFLAVISGSSIADVITSGIGLLAGASISFNVVDRDENLIFSGTIGPVGSGADLESSSSSVTIAVGETVNITSLTYVEAS